MWSHGLLRVFLFLGSIVSANSAAASISSTFDNSFRYKFDTNGNAIDLTSGKIDFLGGTYLWYGLSNGCGDVFCGITSYSSTDLQTWKPNGLLFDASTIEIQGLCAVPQSGNCGRPHIVYSAQNNNYVLWVNSGAPGYVLFTSTTLTSGYTKLPDRALLGFQPPGPFQSGDFGVQVINGTGYIAYSLIDFTTAGSSIWPPFLQSIYFQPLLPSMLNTTGNASHVVTPAGDLVDFEAESPDIFKRGDYLYITASNTCGFCTGTLLLAYRSTSISGPWTRQILSADTCGGQSTGVLALPCPNGGEPSYLHVADLFRTAPLTGTRTAAHGHQFQILSFNSDGSVQDLDCSPDRTFTVDSFAPGASDNSTAGAAVSATDTSGELEDYIPKCNLPSSQLYQTFVSSKTGTLAEVGVNIAGEFPTANTTITVFRYHNNTELFTPRFVWETLATYDAVPSSISQSFQVVRVPVNAQVAQGDRLGIAVVTMSATPLCTLVKERGEVMVDINTSTRTLFAIGVNQVSFRGKDGTTPPVHVLPGQELKWYSIVN